MNHAEIELPEKPSAGIRESLKDLRRCMLDPRYEIDMGTWHQWVTGTQRCHVCHAGAIMARAADTTEFLLEQDIPKRVQAFDYLRDGEVKAFVEQYSGGRMALYVPLYWEDWKYWDACEDKEDYFQQCEQVANFLEGLGL